MEIRYKDINKTFDSYVATSEGYAMKWIPVFETIYVFKDFLVISAKYCIIKVENPSLDIWLEINKYKSIVPAIRYLIRNDWFPYKYSPEIMTILLSQRIENA